MEQTLTRRTFIAGSSAAFAACAAAGLAGCGDNGSSGADASRGGAPGSTSSNPSASDTLIVQADGDPASFCPDTIADDTLLPIAANIFNRLVKLDVAETVIPDAATSWDIADDGLTITFHLRDDLVWSDGEPLTAQDARYTFETIRNDPSCFFCSYLANVGAVEAPDDTTVVFSMREPDISLVTNLGWYANFILPQHVYDKEGVAWTDNEAAQLAHPDKVVSSGPYRIDSYTQGQSVTLVPNEHSPVQPNIPKLVFSIIADETTAVQALVNGEIDAFYGIPAANAREVEATPGIALTSQVEPTPLRIVFNINDKHAGDPAVRRAIALCVDREDISAKVSDGAMPADTCMYPPVISWCSNTDDVAPGCDLEAAEQCLVDAGYEKDDDDFYITGLVIDTFEFAEMPDMAKLIVGNMRSVGLGCEVNVLEQNAWSDKCMQRKDYSICMMGGTMGPDPSSLALRYGTGASSNIGDWSNAEFDELVAQANAEADQEARGDLYRQAQAVMAEELPMVPLLDWVALYGYANRLTDMPVTTETSDGTPLGERSITTPGLSDAARAPRPSSPAPQGQRHAPVRELPRA